MLSGCAFNELDDTQNSYTGQKGRIVTVNTDENGLEFAILTLDSGTPVGIQVDYDQNDLDTNSILTIQHGLNLDYTYVTTYNDQNTEVWPDAITNKDANTIDINFSTLTPLTGVWHTRIVGSDINGTQEGYVTNFDNNDLTNGILALNHNQNKQAPTVSIYNNVGLQILPDDINYVNNNRVDVNLLNYTTLTGTWTARVSKT